MAKVREHDGKQFTSRWELRHFRTWGRHLPKWVNVGEPLNYIEIGVWEARSACWVLEHILKHEDCKAYLIDTFNGPARPSRIPRFGTGEEIEARARNNVRPYEDKVTFLKMTSEEALATDTIQQLRGDVDLVYVDGGHKGDVPFEDTKAAWPLLKNGGVMIWDDTHMKGVIDCIEKFEEYYKSMYQIIWKGGRQIAARKIDG